ncbi:hypothetical protein CASFOL_012383 [Castilleja foliolosa]|uniref:MATH domain-containing protein n=1 Tax=Castilleja foliolosa TaxID=1961234 RepID=A0ABD3DHH3_9LAMI
MELEMMTKAMFLFIWLLLQTQLLSLQTGKSMLLSRFVCLIIARRFHALNQEWGFNKFLSKKDLTDPSNGYIVNDKCVFGAEVFVNENKAVAECMFLKSVDKELPYKREFKLTNFSSLKGEWSSEKFTFGGHA